ncbi:MAG: hypothetical protein H7326_08225 [Bdellovibrionaceae bacterium]|nr:hypothetical protein [Pseudobdellovibrionaceae bacterium]
MKSFYVVTLILSGALNFASAEQSPLCEDMVRYACAPGAHFDGTGYVRRGESESELNYKAYESIKPKIINQFAEVLARRGNEEFRTIAMNAFGMKDAPECASTDSQQLGNCHRAVAEGLTSIARDYITGIESRESYLGASAALEDRKLAERHPAFKETIALLKKTYAGMTIYGPTEKLVRETLFPRVQTLLLQKIKRLVTSEANKKILSDIVSTVGFSGADCLNQGSGLAGDLHDNAYYSRASNKFVMCGGQFIKDVSEFKLVRTIAHELSHSIDPYHVLPAGPDGFGPVFATAKELSAADRNYPVTGLVLCLRSEASVKAERAPSKKLTYRKNDQITEAVADWFGAEILADYMVQYHPELSEAQWQAGIGNSFRASCDAYEQHLKSSFFDEHPNLPRKLNALLLAQPKIRQKMGCLPQSQNFIYCDPENPQATAKRIPAAKEEPAKVTKKSKVKAK